MVETIARLLGWLAAFWPRRPQGKHRKGAQVSAASEPTPPIVRAPVPWPPCLDTARARRWARHAPPRSEPPSTWIDTGPLVRAYVLHHEKRQHAQALRSLGGGARE